MPFRRRDRAREAEVGQTMTQATKSLVLDATRARSGDDPLLAFLRDARHGDVALSMRDVGRLDAMRLQTLLVAQRQWAADGFAFVVTDMSDGFRAGLERLGVPADQFIPIPETEQETAA